jgi:hypothetical protein
MMRAGLALVAMLVACGRHHFDVVDSVSDARNADSAMPDADVPCAQSPCQLVLPQCGCGSGLMCQRTGATTETRGCVTIGTIGADGACSVDADCIPGYLCVNFGGPISRCHAYCEQDGDCASGLQCAGYFEGVGTGMCGSTCTLEGGCPSGTACKVPLAGDFDSAGPAPTPTCADPSGANAGAGCTTSMDCAAGLFCDNGVCAPMCRMNGTLPCVSGTCVQPLAPIFLANVEHGVCR